MDEIAALLTAISSPVPLLFLATVVSFLGYIGRGWIESRAIAEKRHETARMLALDVAAETSQAVRVENVKDQGVLRSELWARIETLEHRIEAMDRENKEESLKATGKHDSAMATQGADNAQIRAEEAQRYLDQLTALRAENAECKIQIASIQADLRNWRQQATRLTEVMGEAGRALNNIEVAVEADIAAEVPTEATEATEQTPPGAGGA